MNYSRFYDLKTAKGPDSMSTAIKLRFRFAVYNFTYPNATRLTANSFNRISVHALPAHVWTQTRKTCHIYPPAAQYNPIFIEWPNFWDWVCFVCTAPVISHQNPARAAGTCVFINELYLALRHIGLALGHRTGSVPYLIRNAPTDEMRSI